MSLKLLLPKEDRLIVQSKSSSLVEANHFQSGGIKIFFFQLLFSCTNICLWSNSGQALH